MQIKFLGALRRPVVVGLALGTALTGSFLLGQAQAQQPAGTTFSKPGLMQVLIKPDKTAAYEAVIAKLKEALQKTDKPELKQAAMGWKVYKADTPANNNVLYIHVIDPPAANADYGVMKILYDAFPAEAQAIFTQYKEAFGGQSIVPMTLVADLGK
jgi:hypothetical protein